MAFALTYIIVDAAHFKTTTRMISAENDRDAIRQTQEFVDTESLADSVTLYRSLDPSGVMRVCDVDRSHKDLQA